MFAVGRLLREDLECTGHLASSPSTLQLASASTSLCPASGHRDMLVGRLSSCLLRLGLPGNHKMVYCRRLGGHCGVFTQMLLQQQSPRVRRISWCVVGEARTRPKVLFYYIPKSASCCLAVKCNVRLDM